MTRMTKTMPRKGRRVKAAGLLTEDDVRAMTKGQLRKVALGALEAHRSLTARHYAARLKAKDSPADRREADVAADAAFCVRLALAQAIGMKKLDELEGRAATGKPTRSKIERTPLGGYLVRVGKLAVERWWNRQERSWVVMLLDENGYQFGTSTYLCGKEAAVGLQEGWVQILEAGKLPAEAFPPHVWNPKIDERDLVASAEEARK